MRLFDIVVFLVILGGLSSAMTYVQTDLSTQGDSSDWWTGHQTQNFTTVVISNEDIDAIATDKTGVAGTIEDLYNAAYFAIGLAWNVFKGVIWVKGSIFDKVIVYNDPTTGENILEPISYLLQGAIYLIVIIGWFQLKAKQPMKGGY